MASLFSKQKLKQQNLARNVYSQKGSIHCGSLAGQQHTCEEHHLKEVQTSSSQEGLTYQLQAFASLSQFSTPLAWIVSGLSRSRWLVASRWGIIFKCLTTQATHLDLHTNID